MIRTENLCKVYGSVVAVDDLSLSIEKGEVFGLLGPNGAGKTTTIKILTTLSRPASGSAFVNGYDVVKDGAEVKKIIGVAPQEINLDRELTAYENLYVYGLLHKAKGLKDKIDKSLMMSGLSERKDHVVKGFSGGMQRRLLIARALLPEPKILFLDEPTVGLDPQVRRDLWDLIRRLKRQGITILLTTHYIEEAEALCDRVGILSHGKLVALDTPEALKQEVGGVVVEWGEDHIRKYALCKDKEEAYLLAKEKNGQVVIRKSNLEDVFIQLTGERITM